MASAARRPVADGGGASAADRAAERRTVALAAVAAAACAVGLLHRLLVGWDAPLWLDETFTAVIVTQPDARALLHWCLNELSGPFFYAPLWLWQRIAGDGDTALRLPGLACSIAAPALILWRGHPDPRTRLLWGGLAAVWVPGLLAASEAKPYALLFLLCAAQAIAFLAMMRAPGRRRAFAWCAITALALLTHYEAAVVGGLQGLAYLAVHRRRAVATWPAALIFVPVAAWMAVHLRVLVLFVNPQVAWFSVLPPRAVFALPNMLFGGGVWPALLVTAVAATWIPQGARLIAGRARPVVPAGEWALAAAGLLAVALVFGMGFVRPSFTSRYLLPSMPAVLFALVLWARGLERRHPEAGTILLAGATAFAGVQFAQRWPGPFDDVRYAYEFERPTAWLRAAGMTRMVFLWDNPTAAITSDVHLREVGGFFDRRAGRPVPILVPRVPRGADPGPLLATAIRPGTGFLWAFDSDVPGSAGVRHPPRLAADPRLRCRDFGARAITVLACIAPPSAAHPPARNP